MMNFLSLAKPKTMSQHPAEPGIGSRLQSHIKIYWQLTKPTITLLVVITLLPGLLLSTTLPQMSVVVAALLGTALSSASAAVFNQLADLTLDIQMKRTQKRPLPSGRLGISAAWVYGIILGVLGIGILWFFTRPQAALLALVAHLFYVLGYTLYLKRRTTQNIVIGGASGAIGPLIGAAAVDALNAAAWIMFLIIFLWTPPHFWALALKYKDDYARVNIPMLPVVKGNSTTRKQIFLYTLSLFPCYLALWWLGSVHLTTLILCLVLTAHFSFKAFQLWHKKDNELAMPVFHVSCVYLLVVFLMITVDRLVHLL